MAVTVLVAMLGCRGSYVPPPRRVHGCPVETPKVTVARLDTPGATATVDGTIAAAEKVPKVGVTVVATTPGAAEQYAITDDKGWYQITNLPPGPYTITLFYEECTYVRSVDLAAGSTMRLTWTGM